MYDSKIGQFLSEDPIEFDGLDLNLKRYVGNLPTLATDPTGLVEMPLVPIVGEIELETSEGKAVKKVTILEIGDKTIKIFTTLEKR